MICNVKQSTFQHILDKKKVSSMDFQNLKALGTKMLKVTKHLTTGIFLSFLKMGNKLNYNLFHISPADAILLNFVYNWTESISFFGPKIWDILPNMIKEKKTVEAFNGAIKKGKSGNCPCTLCKRLTGVRCIWYILAKADH